MRSYTYRPHRPPAWSDPHRA